MLVVFDLDGTLADCSHRQKYVNGEMGKKDWQAFFNLIPYDSVIEPIAKLVWNLPDTWAIVVCTARGEEYRETTIAWLKKHLLMPNKIYFRAAKDHRDDTIVKKEMLDQIIKDYGKKPDLVFDDRKRVVDMWRENGVQCCQVAPGDF